MTHFKPYKPARQPADAEAEAEAKAKAAHEAKLKDRAQRVAWSQKSLSLTLDRGAEVRHLMDGTPTYILQGQETLPDGKVRSSTALFFAPDDLSQADHSRLLAGLQAGQSLLLCGYWKADKGFNKRNGSITTFSFMAQQIVWDDGSVAPELHVS